MKNIFIIRVLIFMIFSGLIFSCKSKKTKVKEKYDLVEKKKKKEKHKPTLAEVFAKSINNKDLENHVLNLTKDTMKGRETGTIGQKMAAQYIEDFFIDQQILPISDEEGYFQQFTVTENNLPYVKFRTNFSSYRFGKDFITFIPHNNILLNDKEIMYGGYGIEDVRYNDYAYRDVKDKILLIRGGEPKDRYGNYLITAGLKPSKWSADPLHSYILKRKAAMRHGVKMLLIYDEKKNDYYWDIFERKFKKKKLSISVKRDSLYDFFISKKMFTDLTGYDSPDEMTLRRRNRKIRKTIKMSYENSSQVIESENVIGIIEGSEKKDEYIAVITHYDGQGERKGVVYPSANDNASGVAATLEIAEAFQIAIDTGFVPKRSLLFINFTGHEQEYHGARFFVRHPVVPLKKIKAVIELHKLGRLRNESSEAALFPLNLKFAGFDEKSFNTAINRINSYNDHIKLYINVVYERSDYILFDKKKIPVIYFHGKTYPDYHKPTDTPDKISYEILKNRTQFIFQIIWDLANQKKL